MPVAAQTPLVSSGKVYNIVLQGVRPDCFGKSPLQRERDTGGGPARKRGGPLEVHETSTPNWELGRGGERERESDGTRVKKGRRDGEKKQRGRGTE